MRRTAILIVFILLLTACGKKARVAIAAPRTVAATGELEGLASYYAEPYNGRRTASGEIFDSYHAMTAAHRTLPFNTMVRVTNKANGEAITVRINDRGPFVDGRVIDLSFAAASKIDLVRSGLVPVKLTVLKKGSETKVEEDKKRSTSSQPLYAVQVGAFESESAAEALRRELDGRYSDVSIQTFSGDKTLYRVRVGRAPTILAAEQLAARLREEHFASFVVRLN
jgi:rare lipoprotein A